MSHPHASLAELLLDARPAPVPAGVRALYTSGALFERDGQALGPLDLPGWEPGLVMQIAVCPPSWDVLAIDLFDDAVVGDEGDWEHASAFLPLFAAEGGVFVVTLDDPALPVGYFAEENWESEGSGFDRGVYRLWGSLDEALSALRGAEGEFMPCPMTGDELWEGVDELG